MASPGIASAGPPSAEKQATHIGVMNCAMGPELETLLLVKRLQSSFCAPGYRCGKVPCNSSMLAPLPDNNTRPEVKVLVYHLQQLPLGLLGGSIGEDGNGQWLCHTNGVGHLPERSDSGTQVIGEISQSRAAGNTLPLLTGLLPLLPGSPSFLRCALSFPSLPRLQPW